MKCFKKCGVISGASGVVTRIGADEDPFDDIDDARELASRLNEIQAPTCSPEEYVTGDDNLPVCDDHDDWDEEFLAGLTQEIGEETQGDDDEEFDLEPPPPKFRTYQEAVSCERYILKMSKHFWTAKDTMNLQRN